MGGFSSLLSFYSFNLLGLFQIIFLKKFIKNYSSLFFNYKMNIININIMLILNFLIFFIGLSGLTVTKKNILIMLMAIELMLLAVNLNFIIFSLYLDDLSGQIFILFILTVSATESVIGLALINAYFKLKGSIVFEKIK